jgi:hypothetical protein
MSPPFSGLMESMTSRRRLRSFSEPMRLETPMWSTVGM